MKHSAKRLLSFLFALVFALGAVPLMSLVSHAESFSGSCGADGDNLTWSFDSDTGVLTIEGSGAMADYGLYETPWDCFCFDIVQVSPL